MIIKLLKAGSALALLCITSFAASAQSFRQLTVDDFQPYPVGNSKPGVVAYTNCTINFSFQEGRDRGERRLNFNVKLNMNTDRSWINRSAISTKAQLDEILKHEQGHYNIAYLEQQEVLRAMSRTRFTGNYRKEAMEIFNKIDAKYKELNENYDSDTVHSTNKQQQRSWDMYFEKRLAYMPPTNQDD